MAHCWHAPVLTAERHDHEACREKNGTTCLKTLFLTLDLTHLRSSADWLDLATCVCQAGHFPSPWPASPFVLGMCCGPYTWTAARPPKCPRSTVCFSCHSFWLAGAFCVIAERHGQLSSRCFWMLHAAETSFYWCCRNSWAAGTVQCTYLDFGWQRAQRAAPTHVMDIYGDTGFRYTGLCLCVCVCVCVWVGGWVREATLS